MLPPKPANCWFVLRVNGAMDKLRFGNYQEAVWRANELRSRGALVEIVNAEGAVVDVQP